MNFEGLFLNINDYNLFENKRLGKGAYGIVYIVENKNDHKQYAAKIIDVEDNFDGNDQVQLLRESWILLHLNHPSIVKFIGFSFRSFRGSSILQPTIITEYLPKGSLKDILDKEKSGIADYNWSPTKKYICLIGIADAMRYLHSHQVLHRDLKPQNILIDANYYPRICDFGLSRCFPETFSKSMTGQIGTPLYMAPEIFASDEDHVKYGPEVDVYSFSFLAYEIVTGKEPFYELDKKLSISKLRKKILNGDRPIFKNDVPVKMQNLLKNCWDGDAKKRPSFQNIFELLSSDFSYSPEDVDVDEINEYIEMIKDNEDSISFEEKELMISNCIEIIKEKLQQTKNKKNLQELINELTNVDQIKNENNKLMKSIKELKQKQKNELKALNDEKIKLQKEIELLTNKNHQLEQENEKLKPKEDDDSNPHERVLLRNIERKRRAYITQIESSHLIPKINSINSFNISEKGVFCVRFSHNGKILAAVVQTNDHFDIQFFSIIKENSKINIRFQSLIIAHHDIVNEIEFSNDDQFLLSISNDGMAKVWNTKNNGKQVFQLQHNCPLLTGKFHPLNNNIIATAGVDGLLKIWDINKPKCLIELKSHKSKINSIVFSPNGKFLYSSDELGCICIWDTDVEKHDIIETKLIKCVIDSEIKNCSITNLDMAKSNIDLLVQAQDQIIRIFETKIMVPAKRFCPSSCLKKILISQFSPDRSFIISGSEDGYLSIWNIKLYYDNPSAIMTFRAFFTPITSIAWNPTDDLIAVSTVEENYNIAFLSNSHISFKNSKALKLGLPVLKT